MLHFTSAFGRGLEHRTGRGPDYEYGDGDTYLSFSGNGDIINISSQYPYILIQYWSL